MLKKKIIGCAIAAAAMAAVSVPAAHAEVSASVGAANMYYWRGVDLGAGDAQIWGDISVSEGGFYAGLWAASGDAANGQEYDLYAGYGLEIEGGLTIDASIWTYAYPSCGMQCLDDPGELSEVILSIGFGPVAYTYYDNIAGASSYVYHTLSGSIGDFTLTYGMHDMDSSEESEHLDLSYAFNDNLTFTLGHGLEAGDFGVVEGTKVVVSFGLPIEL